MSKDSKELTIFFANFSAFAYLVMPFNLCNKPAFWHHLLNITSFDFLHCFVQAYLDNILIYSKTPMAYRLHSCQMLKHLQKAEIQTDIDKCKFYI